MAEFPIEPKLAKMLVSSATYECSEEILSIAAMLSVRSYYPSAIALAHANVGPTSVYQPPHGTRSCGCDEEKVCSHSRRSLYSLEWYLYTSVNACVYAQSKPFKPLTPSVYNAFIKNEMSKKWCQENYVNYKSLMRAYDVRSQLRKYMRKFEVPMISAQVRRRSSMFSCCGTT